MLFMYDATLEVNFQLWTKRLDSSNFCTFNKDRKFPVFLEVLYFPDPKNIYVKSAQLIRPSIICTLTGEVIFCSIRNNQASLSAGLFLCYRLYKHWNHSFFFLGFGWTKLKVKFVICQQMHESFYLEYFKSALIPNSL